MTENWYPEADPNRDRSMPLWPKLPTVPALGSSLRTRPRGMDRPWAQRLATAAAAVVLSLGGGAVVGAAALRLETDTVAVAGLAPSGPSGAAPSGWSGAAVAVGVAARSGASGVAGAASITVARLRAE